MATSTTGELHQLPNNTRHFSHLALIGAATLTDPTGASVQTIDFILPANSRIEDVLMELTTPFGDDGDAAFDDVTVAISGGSGTPTALITARQVGNGSPVRFAALDKSAVAGPVLTTAGALRLVFTPETGKALVNLDRGELKVFLNLQKMNDIG